MSKIIEFGPDARQKLVTGTFIKTTVKVGDTVILPTMGFTKLQHKGDEYYIGSETQILAKVNSTTSIKEVLEQTEVSPEEKTILKQ
jgi:co-chaperonin GroES (HSP10)